MNRCKLGELLTIKQGYAFKSENYVEKSEFLLVTLANISESNNFQLNTKKASYYGASFPQEFILQDNDLIMPLTEQVVGLFGNTAFVPKVDNTKFILNQRVGKVIPKNDRADKYYLHYLLATDGVRKQLEYRASGTRQRNISPNDIYDVDVFIPNYEKQKKIGNILYNLEKKINCNNRINAELESMAKTIYDYWFVQFEFPNEDGKPYKSSGGKMVWNEELKREIPEGWKVKGIEYFGELKNGINYDKGIQGDKDYKIVNVKNISATTLMLNRSDMDDICLLSKSGEKYLIKEDNILIARSGIPGAVRIFNTDVENTIFCGFIICLSLKNNLYKDYLVYKLKDYENTTATTSGGTIMQNVSQDTLKRLRFVVPDQKIIIKFNKKIDSIWNLLQNNLSENQELTKLRDFLLPLLMNGQVAFKEDIVDEIRSKEIEEKELISK